MHRIYRLFLVVFLFAALPCTAREITAKEAGKAAAAWVKRDVSPLGENMGSFEVAEVRTTLGDDGTPLFHVVRMEGGGTVVTSAESGITPIIAFLDGGDVDETPGSPLFEILNADLALRNGEVAAVRGGGLNRVKMSGGEEAAADPFAEAESAWAGLLDGRDLKYGVSSVSDVRVAKLLSTTWGQSSGAANYYTPPYEAGNEGNYVCGCVALAGAQIAKYWIFPTESRPKVTRTCYVSGSSVSKTSMGGTYEWSSMPNSFSGMTTAQKQAVGKLCYDFGVATYMDWASGASGAGGYCLDDAFRTVFGYANSRTQVQDGGAFSADIIKRAILANLDAKCPVSLGIKGHQVVADGYGYSSGTLYTHINLGWTGGGDAWYNLPTVDATSMGYTSTVLDEVIYNIFPQKTGDLLTGRVLDQNGNPVSGASVTGVNGSTTVSATTDGHGVYALWVTGGKSWTVTASYGSSTSSKSVSVTASVSTRVSGEFYTPGTGTVGNSWGNDITLGVTVPALTLAAALDNTSLSFTTGGDAAWMPQVDETHDGTDAAQSGAIGASQSSWLQTTVTGAGKISFWWNVSSESVNYDYLEFLVDGTQNAKIGGTTGTWAQKTVTVSGTGTHTFRWTYRKDSSDDRGSDCGWVDQVVWTPAATAPSAPTGVTAADGTSTANCTVSWSAVSGATSYTVYRHTSNASGSSTAVKSGVTGTSYADTAATPGTLYYYWVKAVNSAWTSAYSASDSGYRKLSAPTISSATESTSGVALSWGAVTGATHYRVFRAASTSGTKTALGSWQTGRTYTDTTGTAGTTYYYFVQAAANSSGTRPGDYSAPVSGMKKPMRPDNDDFAQAITLSGYSGSVSIDSTGATAQSGEPLHADVTNAGSVWWTWTAPAKGTIEISTAGSAFDTVLGVYTGTAVGSLSKVASNDDHGGSSTSRVIFDTAAAGTIYRIAVAGYDGATGALALSWRFEALNAATFTDMALNPATGVAHVSFKARKGMSYKIQRASSLGGTWTTVKTITPTATGTVESDVSIPTSWQSGFVRVVVTE